MNTKVELSRLVSEVNDKLKKISEKVNGHGYKDDFSKISVLINVNEELDDVLLNWDSGQIIPDRLIQMFKNPDSFDDDFDDD